MNTPDTESKGFKIVLKTIPASESDLPCASIDLAQLSEQIIQFIARRLIFNKNMRIAVAIENWDDSFDLEESIYEISRNEQSRNGQDYTRNYWIGNDQ